MSASVHFLLVCACIYVCVHARGWHSNGGCFQFSKESKSICINFHHLKKTIMGTLFAEAIKNVFFLLLRAFSPAWPKLIRKTLMNKRTYVKSDDDDNDDDYSDLAWLWFVYRKMGKSLTNTTKKHVLLKHTLFCSCSSFLQANP